MSRLVRQYASFSTTKFFFFHRESIYVFDKVDTLSYGGVSALLPVLTPTSSYSFRKSNLPLTREIFGPQNISTLWYEPQDILRSTPPMLKKTTRPTCRFRTSSQTPPALSSTLPCPGRTGWSGDQRCSHVTTKSTSHDTLHSYIS